MQFPTRKDLLLAFLAVHGCLVALGPSLHGLPGLEHPGSLHQADGSTTGRSSAAFAVHDDCPVCHLLTHGQFLSSSNLGLLPDVVARHSTGETPILAPAPTFLQAHPRAPPQI